MYQKVIIEDLQNADKSELPYSDAMRIKAAKEAIRAEQRLAQRQPRDLSVWTKTLFEKQLLTKLRK
jgi:hypothetical protein